MSNRQLPIDAKTSDGRAVLLRPEGNWEYKDASIGAFFRERKETSWYLLWGTLSLLLLVLGYGAEHEYHWELRSHILNELGVAGFVAIILAVTIEYVSKKRDERRFKEEKDAIKNDVFEHVLGYRLPEGTFASLDDQILNASFFRKDFAVRYELSPLENPAFIKIDGQISYKVLNLTPEPKDFYFRTGTEKAPVAELDHLVKFTVVRVRDSAGNDLLDLDSVDKIKTAQDESIPNHLHIRQTITINGNDRVSATIRFEAVRALQGGSAFLLTPNVALGFQLFVQAWDGIEVSATSYLPETLKKGDQHLKGQNSYHWVLERPMLPYQGVYLSWTSRATTPPADQAPPQVEAPIAQGTVPPLVEPKKT